MSFADFLSQGHIIKHFRKAINNDHLSHAYIFTGQNGIGKSLFAKEFSKALFCNKSKGDSCNICKNCIRIDNNTHPDIHWIVLEKKSKFIKIDNIRNLQHFVKLSPVESEYKVFIIKEADRMNEEASNCLLKTLEEPTPNTFIILTADSLMPIRETIRSRCQIVRFTPIPNHIIKDQLVKIFNADTREIEWVSRFCNGSLGDAIELLREKFYEKNNDIVNRISGLNMGNFNFAEEFIDSYLGSSDSLEEKRQTLKRILNCILQFYRDLLMVKIRNVHSARKKKLPLFNAEREEALQGLVNYLTQEQIITIVDEILLTIKHLDYNLNINLLVENIFARIAVLNSAER